MGRFEKKRVQYGRRVRKGDIDNKADKWKASRAYTAMWQLGLELTLEWEGVAHRGCSLYQIMRPWSLMSLSDYQTHFYQQNGMSPVTENNNIHGLSLYEADCSMNDKRNIKWKRKEASRSDFGSHFNSSVEGVMCFLY